MAITERAVYVGGHFGFEESPTAPDPWPGLDNVGYGTGQGLAGYGLGDAVVRRDHIGALNPADGKALEWNPGSNSFEGNKAMEATARGLFVGGDGMYQGGENTGRVAFYDLNTAPAATAVDTTIDTPIEGRVVQSGVQFTIQGRGTATGGRSGGSRSRSRTATPSSTSRTTSTAGAAPTTSTPRWPRPTRPRRPGPCR